jgi:hypothetical protein
MGHKRDKWDIVSLQRMTQTAHSIYKRRMRLDRIPTSEPGRRAQGWQDNIGFEVKKPQVSYRKKGKKSLGYIDPDEFRIKIEMCQKLNIRPVFVVRMMPKTWIQELQVKGGFALIKYQLYPWTHKNLARKVARELEIPVDSPRVLKETTMNRFIKWHEKQVNSKGNSQKINING